MAQIVSDYKDFEAALLARFQEVFPTQLSPTRCKASDLDGVVAALYGEEGAEYALLVEFNGGQQMNKAPFNKPMWHWFVVGMFFLRPNLDEELTALDDKLRNVVLPGFKSMFADGHHTLGGVTPLAEFERIERAEAETINDMPVYILPFTISMIDKAR